MLDVSLEGDRLHFGKYFSVSFQRTLRLPDDDRTYPLPPGLGLLPVRRVEEAARLLPQAWSAGDFFIPMYQREALWLGFDAPKWRPCAVKIGTGRINPVSGEVWAAGLHADPQDYIVCPTQPWLDGINAGDGHVRQFVAMPLGEGYTIEGQVSGAEEAGGIQLLVYAAKPGRFPETAPAAATGLEVLALREPQPMGLAAGGRMRQDIYQDPFGVDVWDVTAPAAAQVHIVNSEQYRELMGVDPPASPIDAATYTAHGLPWFELYDEEHRPVPPSDRLSRVESVAGLDRQRGRPPHDDDHSVDVPARQRRTIVRRTRRT